MLRVFQELGARYLTLTHFANVPWADAATDLPAQSGLTAPGRQLIRENGMADVSCYPYLFAELSRRGERPVAA